MKLQRRICAWVCMLAVLASALIPLGAQAGYAASGDPAWFEICTANGLARVRSEADSQEEGQAVHQQPCKWCKYQSGLVVLLVGEVPLPGPFAGGCVRLLAQSGFMEPRLVWSTAQPRAPPRI